MVKNYTDKELLDKVKSLSSFQFIPSNYWILGIRSTQDLSNKFDDKFYLFYGEKFIQVTTGTTNPGSTYLLRPVHTKGAAVIKANEWYYKLWKYGMHRKYMPALRQQIPIIYYRDNNHNLKSEELGYEMKGNIGINFHTITYDRQKKGYKITDINKWSAGCQVCNIVDDYYSILDKVKEQDYVSYCLINEF